MSSLFSNLPPETADKHAREPVEETMPPNKKLKTDRAAPAAEQPSMPQHAGQDAVAAALIKITSHISSNKKFPKASELLRQLILEHKIGEEHSKLVFEVVACKPALDESKAVQHAMRIMSQLVRHLTGTESFPEGSCKC